MFQGTKCKKIFHWIYNVYLNGLFHPAEMIDVCSFAENTIFHDYDSDLNIIFHQEEKNDACLVTRWFELD